MPDASNAADTAEDDAAPDTASDATLDTFDEAEVSERDVVVPLSLYKIVTVFSTLISGASVVAGFMVLDTATQRASVPAEEIDPLLALLGLALIAGGGAVYAFAGRFRAPGMGTPKNEDDEGRDNG